MHITKPQNKKRRYAIHYKNIFSITFSASVFLLTSLHIIISSDIFMVISMATISLIGLCFLNMERIYFSNIFVFITSLYSGYLPLLIKVILFQPLQSNLFTPHYSTFLLVCGFMSLSICSYLIAHGNKKNIMSLHFNNRNFIKYFSWPILIVGLFLHILHVVFKPVAESGVFDADAGFGGFGSFYFLLIMAICLGFKGAAIERNSQPFVVFILVAGIAMFLVSVIANVKKDVIDFAFLAVVSVYTFNFRIKTRYVATFLLLAFVVVGYVSPALHIMRSTFTEISAYDRLLEFFKILSDNSFSYERLASLESAIFAGFQLSYNPYGSYIFPSTLNLDRFMLILPIDQVARQVPYAGLMGLDPFVREVFEGVLPSFLIDKSSYVGADLIAWHFGFRDLASVARPVVGFTASATAAWGAWGALLLPIVILYPILTLVDYLFGELKNNAWCLFVVGCTSQLAEKEVDAVIVFVLRQIPLMLVTSFALILLYTLFIKRR